MLLVVSDYSGTPDRLPRSRRVLSSKLAGASAKQGEVIKLRQMVTNCLLLVITFNQTFCCDLSQLELRFYDGRADGFTDAKLSRGRGCHSTPRKFMAS